MTTIYHGSAHRRLDVDQPARRYSPLMDILSLLEQSDFFRALSAARRRAVAAICIPKTLRKREMLFLEGETGHSMYLMAQGARPALQDVDRRARKW